MLLTFLSLLVVGAFGGVLSGLLGIGGGIIVVPMLIYWLPLVQFPEPLIVPTAIGTSLATILVTTSSSAWAHTRAGHMHWDWVRKLTPTLIIGALFGAWLGISIDPKWLQRIFSVMLFVLAVRMLMRRKKSARTTQASFSTTSLAGFSIGTISALIGIGGGTLVVPFLYGYRLAMTQAIAVAAFSSIVLSAVSVLLYAAATPQGTQEIPGLIGYIYLPAWAGIAVTSVLFAPLGAKITTRLPVLYLQRLFAGLLVLVSIHLFMSG